MEKSGAEVSVIPWLKKAKPQPRGTVVTISLQISSGIKKLGLQ